MPERYSCTAHISVPQKEPCTLYVAARWEPWLSICRSALWIMPTNRSPGASPDRCAGSGCGTCLSLDANGLINRLCFCWQQRNHPGISTGVSSKCLWRIASIPSKDLPFGFCGGLRLSGDPQAEAVCDGQSVSTSEQPSSRPLERETATRGLILGKSWHVCILRVPVPEGEEKN